MNNLTSGGGRRPPRAAAPVPHEEFNQRRGIVVEIVGDEKPWRVSMCGPNPGPEESEPYWIMDSEMLAWCFCNLLNKQ
jgi:hypothetical protein